MTKKKLKKFDSDKPRFSLVPQKGLLEVMKVLEFGAKKYGADNWRNIGLGDDVRYKDAIARHLIALNNDELYDRDSGLTHYAHIACSALFMAELSIPITMPAKNSSLLQPIYDNPDEDPYSKRNRLEPARLSGSNVEYKCSTCNNSLLAINHDEYRLSKGLCESCHLREGKYPCAKQINCVDCNQMFTTHVINESGDVLTDRCLDCSV